MLTCEAVLSEASFHLKSLIRMSELHPKHAVITVDETDFGVYRRNGREAIPLITPSRRSA